MGMGLLERINEPADLAGLNAFELEALAEELREVIVGTVTRTSGHLGSNLGAVELTIALHRVFDSPSDLILWDTGHQAYAHKLLTGRRDAFAGLRQAGGLSGYPNREESPHDWVENSHASTILSWAHGLAASLALGRGPATGAGRPRPRRVVAVVGDGALTGGMAYEALNNLGHSGARVVIVFNDNGRSYAPTISKLSESLSRLRLNPSYLSARAKAKAALRRLPRSLETLAHSGIAGLSSALREVIEPHVFFEALGVRYTGPLDGHDIAGLESALARAAAWDGPIVVHVLTHKGKGYAPAEDDEIACLHDFKVPAASDAGSPGAAAVGKLALRSYTDAFTRAMLHSAEADPALVAITAAMPGPTGLLPFAANWPERFFDVGIAEAHAVTAAAGMAMGGLHPVVAVYATFFSRAFDQANLDVGLHCLPVVFALDRAGVTGDDGPSHHGILDMAQCLSIPGMAVFAPSSPEDVAPMLAAALAWNGPAALRWPKTIAPEGPRAAAGDPMRSRLVAAGTGDRGPRVVIWAVGKMLAASLAAAEILTASGADVAVWDVRVLRPSDPSLLASALDADLVVTVEDGINVGGAGTFLTEAAAAAAGGLLRGAALHLGVPVAYHRHGKPDAILQSLGLDGPGIARSVAEVLENAAGGEAWREGALGDSIGRSRGGPGDRVTDLRSL